MEAATASGSELLLRDGSVPAAVPTARAIAVTPSEPIDGVARCACCKRFPLVGESVVRHEGKSGPAWVCERCESAGRGTRAGRATGRARIRTLGGAMNVRRAV